MTKYPLKAWNDTGWKRQLTPTLTVSRVDADIPTVELRGKRKPWYVALTQPTPNMHAEVSKVEGLPPRHTVLLSEEDTVALVRYLLESQMAVWSEEPEPTKPGECACLFFEQPGLIHVSDD